MKKHLGTIIGIVLTLGAAFAIFAWDWDRRSESGLHRALALHERCYDEHRAGGASISQEFPECEEFLRADRRAESSRMTSAGMTGAGAGVVVALLFFGGRRMMRRREPAV